AVAVRAQHLGARGAQRMVGPQDHRVGFRRVEERRPAAVRLEFLCAAEQFSTAGAALVHALGLGVGVFTGEGPLGAGLAQHLELFRAEFLAPLVVGQLQLRTRHVWGGHASTLARGGLAVSHAGSMPSSSRFSALASRNWKYSNVNVTISSSDQPYVILRYSSARPQRIQLNKSQRSRVMK